MKTGIIKGDQFTPYTMEKVKGLLPLLGGINTESLQPKKDVEIPQHIICFFMRYLAGGKNLKGQFAEIDLVDFMNHISGTPSKESMIKTVVRQNRLMIKGKRSLSGRLTIEKITQLNQLLNPKNNQGIRKKRLRVGNKKTNTRAFEACDFTQVKGLLDDFLVFLNDEAVDILHRLIIGTYQFAMIHPFMDGNGRTWRYGGDLDGDGIIDRTEAITIFSEFMRRMGLGDGTVDLDEAANDPQPSRDCV